MVYERIFQHTSGFLFVPGLPRELQANYGSHLTSDTPMAVSFGPEADGQTILCLLQFTPDMPPELVKSTRYTRQVIFDKYVQRRGWSWLRLEFQEQSLPRPVRR